jgi:hypothetical protein
LSFFCDEKAKMGLVATCFCCHHFLPSNGSLTQYIILEQIRGRKISFPFWATVLKKVCFDFGSWIWLLGSEKALLALPIM